jgi:ligand-binding sensor domain-containing protein
MRAAVLAVLAIYAALGVGKAVSELSASSGATVARWTERARRLPLPLLLSPERTSVVAQGEPLATHELHARILEEIPLHLAQQSPVVALVEDGPRLYAGTFDEGLVRITNHQLETLETDPRINDLARDAKGQIVAATARGLYEIDPAGNARQVDPTPFTSVAQWRGKTWLASKHGLSVREASGLWTRGPAQGVLADLPDALADCGDFLCIGASDGLWLFDGETAVRHSAASNELPADWVTAIGFSRTSGIWAGTFDGGFANLSAGGAHLFSDALPERGIANHAVAIVGDTVYAGTPTGLLVISPRRAALVRDGKLSEGVSAVIASKHGGLWLGLAGALQRVDFAPGVI